MPRSSAGSRGPSDDRVPEALGGPSTPGSDPGTQGEGGGLAIARLSDLVRKSRGESQGDKKEPPLSFARMETLLGPSAQPAAEQPAMMEAADRAEENSYQLAQQEVASILDAASRAEACNVATLRGLVVEMAQDLASGDALLL